MKTRHVWHSWAAGRVLGQPLFYGARCGECGEQMAACDCGAWSREFERQLSEHRERVRYEATPRCVFCDVERTPAREGEPCPAWERLRR